MLSMQMFGRKERMARKKVEVTKKENFLFLSESPGNRIFVFDPERFREFLWTLTLLTNPRAVN